MLRTIITALCANLGGLGVSAFKYTPGDGTFQRFVDNSTNANADVIATTHFHL